MVAIIDFAWLIPILPALAALIITFFGKFTPEKGGWIAVSLVGAASILALLVFWEVRSGNIATIAAFQPGIQGLGAMEHATFEWWSTGDYSITFGLFVDNLTAFMLFIVGILVFLIVLYSTGYMHAEGTARRRYYAEITLFIAGMLGLVLANNYLMLFIFWEIMGLCSYLLIGYWFEKPSAAAAAKKAFLTTRVGDIFFLAGLTILFVQFKSLDFDVLFSQTVADADLWWLAIANVCILLGAVGKSAQFPLHVWLPDAMEGPTTVSALIHAATMVKAGVYLVARSFPLFVQTPEILAATAVVGGFTALFAASMALFNWDLKRVLAYSTLSQLGYMFLGLGAAGAVAYTTGNSGDAFAIIMAAMVFSTFHLFAHAFFKAGLFLSAGSVGHAVHTYDMRAMGGLRKHMPVTALTMLVGSISIAGVPFFSGFYSKDGLLEVVMFAAHYNPMYYVLWGMGVLTAFMTAYYMFRLYFLTFEGEYRGHGWKDARMAAIGAPAIVDDEEHGSGDEGHGHVHLHESPATMTIPLGILAFFAVFGSIIMFFLLGGQGVGFLANNALGELAAETGLSETARHAIELVEGTHGVAGILHPFFIPVTYVSVAAAFGGIALAWWRWRPSAVLSAIRVDHEETGFVNLTKQRYHIDQAYNWVLLKGVYGLALVEAWFDKYVIDGIVDGIATLNVKTGDVWRKAQTGNVQDYAMVFVAGLVFLVLAIAYGVTLMNLANDYGVLPALFGGGA